MVSDEIDSGVGFGAAGCAGEKGGVGGECAVGCGEWEKGDRGGGFGG